MQNPKPTPFTAKAALGLVHDFFPAAMAGLIAVLISYAGPLLVVLQAAQAAHLSNGQLASWVWAISFGAGICSVWMSWRHRIPVVCAWNTPGAALLATALATISWEQALGAYLFAAMAVWLVGCTGAFERLLSRIPQSLCAAMLAGILLRFGMNVFVTAQAQTPTSTALIAGMFLTYLLIKRQTARYAVPAALLVGVLLWLLLGWGQMPTETGQPMVGLAWQWSSPLWTSPEWNASAIVSLGLPLAVLCLTGQQMPGMAVLRASGYTTPSSPLVTGTGLVSALLAPFGAHGINLAAITAAICTGPQAHPNPDQRWVAGLACGAFYLVLGSFAGIITGALMGLPQALVVTIAGLALLGAIQSGLHNALQRPEEAEAALITFLVTASNVTLWGLGSPCWGLMLGLLAYFLLRLKPV